MNEDWDDVYGRDLNPVEETMLSNILAQRNQIQELEAKALANRVAIMRLEANLADAAAALKEIFDGKNWRLGQKFDPNSGNFDLSTQRKAYIKIKGEQP